MYQLECIWKCWAMFKKKQKHAHTHICIHLNYCILVLTSDGVGHNLIPKKVGTPWNVNMNRFKSLAIRRCLLKNKCSQAHVAISLIRSCGKSQPIFAREQLSLSKMLCLPQSHSLPYTHLTCCYQWTCLPVQCHKQLSWCFVACVPTCFKTKFRIRIFTKINNFVLHTVVCMSKRIRKLSHFFFFFKCIYWF